MVLIITGQLESTMLLASARNSNLLAILDDDDILRTTVHGLTEALNVMQAEDTGGFRLATLVNPNTQDLHPSGKTRLALSPDYFIQLSNMLGHTNITNEVISLEQIAFQGVYYGTVRSKYFRNSAIIFNTGPGFPGLSPEQNGVDDKVGIIDMIFEYPSWTQGEAVQKTFVFVKEHLPAQRPGFHDPYRKYGFAAGLLCKGEANTLHLIELQQIVSHFALTTLPDEGLIHVMPVDRVESFQFILSFCLPISTCT